MSNRGRVPGERLYALLLRLHPASFRERYEGELRECLRDAWTHEAEGRGVGAAVLFWMRLLRGTLATAIRQRLHGRRQQYGEERMKTIGTRLDAGVQDVRYALRMLRRSPGFAVSALLTMGLSIGAATAVYAVVQGVLLQPLPFAASERLYRVAQDGVDGSYWLSAPNYQDLKARMAGFESMGAYTPDGANMLVEGEPARVSVAETDADFFATLGVVPVLGRVFTEEERRTGASVAVVSAGLWRERLGGGADALGKTLVLDGRAREVIGVLPDGLMLPAGTEVWTPLNFESPDWRTRRGITWIQVVARARPDADPAVLQAEAVAVGTALRAEHPDANERMDVGLRPLEEALVGNVRGELRLIMAAVALVLLVAAVNIGGLLLARLISRQGEVAVRSALGGNRWRLVRQFLTEGAVLAGLGCALGLLLGRFALRALLAVAPPAMPRLDEVSMGWETVLFAVAASACAALVFGVLPVLPLRDATAALRARVVESRGSGRLRRGLVVVQVALAISLLCGAGLLGKSFWRMQQVELGFDASQVVVAGLPIGDSDFESAEARELYYQRILEEAQALPGVATAALTSSAPYAGFGVVFDYALPDRADEAGGEPTLSRFRIVSPQLFETLGIPLVRGRAFTASDRRGAVVSADLVQRHYANEDPIGRRIVTAGDTFEIVGVVPSIRDFSARETSPFPFVYVPVMPAVRQSMSLVLRADGDAGALVEPVRQMVRRVAPAQPVTPLEPMAALMAQSTARPRFTLVLLMFFAGATLLLAGVGLYGLLAYTVGRRTREIGVRLALGASVGRVRALVMRQAYALAAAGTLVGLLLALWGGRFLESMLFEVDAQDPLIFGGVVVMLAVVALVAAWIPARRATRIPPVQALRSD